MSTQQKHVSAKTRLRDDLCENLVKCASPHASHEGKPSKSPRSQTCLARFLSRVSPENQLLLQHNKVEPDFLWENQCCHYRLN